MMIRIKSLHSICALLAVGMLIFSCLPCRAAGKSEIRHTVKVMHPGIDPVNAVDCTLIQLRYGNGRRDEYGLEMDSVSCGDAQCAVVTVRMIWNELGFYERLELEPGIKLEKADGKPFTKADAAKLDRILSDRDTSIWNVSQKELVEYRDTDNEVDGVTAATLLPNKNQYVEGAVWTCYTLWHWANGDVPAIVREMTASSMSLGELYAYLSDDDTAYRLFALEQLTARKAYDPQTLSAVVRCAATDDYDLLWMMADYAKEAEPEVYFTLLDRLYRSGNPKLRLICLDALLTTEHEVPDGCYEKWARQLAGSASYMELNRFINILEQKGGISSVVLAQLMPLLDSDSFIVARRAYWFLNGQELSPEARSTLSAFYDQYSDRL